jgi:hypothetical protein
MTDTDRAAHRSIEAAGYAKITAPSSFGRPARLEWLPIAKLVIDPEYQREITTEGRKNIRIIASKFNWSMFAPVIVAKCGGGLYAIVDGQHRTTAAALVGIESVPCAVIEAVRGEQAAAFRAINGNTTRLHTLQLFHAAVAARDPDALLVVEVCARAGAKIMRSPTQTSKLKPGQTLVVGTIAKGIARFGEAVTILGLRCLIESGGGNAGLLNRTVVCGALEVLADHKEWHAFDKR